MLPGAREALQTLANKAGVRQSVLTGNTRDVAHVKIEVFGLGRYLDLRVGAFGDDHRDRATLVAVARARACERFGHPVDADKVLVIGDTPNDVRAAQAAGAHVIGVATGRYSADDLRGAGALTTLASLTDLTRLTESLAVI